MERKWVIAAFLDITGSRSWMYRASTAPEMKETFLTEFYRVLQAFVLQHYDSWSKYMGDGLLIIREFDPTQRTDRRSILNFLLELRCLLRKSRKLLKTLETAPDGVRIRIMDGYAYKVMVLDPNDPDRKRLIPEYLEYCINTVRGLLDVNPEIACMATESLVKNIGKSRSLFRVRPLGKPSCYPKGVNKEDVDGLQVLKF